MSDIDPFEIHRDVTPSVTAELNAGVFDDAREIGRGGFGVVFRCTQTSLDRTVAVKVLTNDVPEENRERFFREQRAMGRLTGHPNIVTVLQVGVTDSSSCRTTYLDKRIRRHGPLPVDEVLRLGVTLAGALQAARNEGILHRDVKPANILLTDYGEPALSDFGIAHSRNHAVGVDNQQLPCRRTTDVRPAPAAGCGGAIGNRCGRAPAGRGRSDATHRAGRRSSVDRVGRS